MICSTVRLLKFTTASIKYAALVLIDTAALALLGDRHDLVGHFFLLGDLGGAGELANERVDRAGEGREGELHEVRGPGEWAEGVQESLGCVATDALGEGDGEDPEHDGGDEHAERGVVEIRRERRGAGRPAAGGARR